MDRKLLIGLGALIAASCGWSRAPVPPVFQCGYAPGLPEGPAVILEASADAGISTYLQLEFSMPVTVVEMPSAPALVAGLRRIMLGRPLTVLAIGDCLYLRRQVPTDAASVAAPPGEVVCQTASDPGARDLVEEALDASGVATNAVTVGGAQYRLIRFGDLDAFIHELLPRLTGGAWARGRYVALVTRGSLVIRAFEGDSDIPGYLGPSQLPPTRPLIGRWLGS